MLRQLYMTLNFYQVNSAFSLFNSNFFNHPNISYSHTPKNINLSFSNFVLFPYIIPKSPYRTPPPSIPQAACHIRRQAIYDDLKKLKHQQLQKFLSSYQTFKHPNFGEKNPTYNTNPFYQWVIKHNLSAWEIKPLIMDDKTHLAAKPLWCQARMGQSRTLLADGRIILIGGEYEDFYDPDFCIYNDVIVINTDKTIEVYSYPKAVFAPTDFHTATLVGTGDNEHIIIIGSLGYPDDRQYSHTPVYRLDTKSFKIEQVATRNSMGWIHEHKTELKDNQIIVKAGQVLIDDTAPLLDNIDIWILNLNTLIWKNSTKRDQKWQRFYVKRQDGNFLNLWYY